MAARMVSVAGQNPGNWYSRSTASTNGPTQIRAGKGPPVMVDQAKIREPAARLDEGPGCQHRVGLQLMAPNERGRGSKAKTEDDSE
jgi:hypothetical protein